MSAANLAAYVRHAEQYGGLRDSWASPQLLSVDSPLAAANNYRFSLGRTGVGCALAAPEDEGVACPRFTSSSGPGAQPLPFLCSGTADERAARMSATRAEQLLAEVPADALAAGRHLSRHDRDATGAPMTTTKLALAEVLSLVKRALDRCVQAAPERTMFGASLGFDLLLDQWEQSQGVATVEGDLNLVHAGPPASGACGYSAGPPRGAPRHEASPRTPLTPGRPRALRGQRALTSLQQLPGGLWVRMWPIFAETLRHIGNPDRFPMTTLELIEVAEGRWLAVDCCHGRRPRGGAGGGRRG